MATRTTMRAIPSRPMVGSHTFEGRQAQPLDLEENLRVED